ncbi:MAG: spermidine synthase [Formosimonas sp.]
MKSSKSRYQAEPITFSEIDDVRYLHFGTPWVQGAMNLNKPFKLELEYAQMMMSYILFMDEPAQVAQLGMGCASLTKFIYKRMPATQSTVVELNPDVISAAYSMFKLPTSERITVVNMDAEQWVAQHKGAFDVLQIDLYDATARGPVCDSIEFYQNCRAALRDVGMLTVNLFGDHDSFAHNMANLNVAFDGRVIALPEVHDGNRIALAFKGPAVRMAWDELYERAAVVKDLYKLKAKRWVNGLKAEMSGLKAFEL